MLETQLAPREPEHGLQRLTQRHGSLSLREAKPIPPLEPSHSEARWRAHGPTPSQAAAPRGGAGAGSPHRGAEGPEAVEAAERAERLREEARAGVVEAAAADARADARWRPPRGLTL